MAAWSHEHAVSAGRPDWTSFRPLPALFAVWAVLIGAALLQDLAGWQGDARIWVLDVDTEDSFYTWFSQLMLAAAAVLLWDTGRKTAAASGGFGAHWMTLGGFFMLLSVDEALSFHERLSSPVRSALDTSGFLTFAWVIPAGLLCLVGFMALVPFLRQLPARVRALMILSAVMFLGGALGMELVGGWLFGDNDEALTTLSYRLAVVIEEGLEGLGVLVFLYSIMLYRRERRIEPGVGSV